MNEFEDLYEILQVHPSAHQEVIQAAYRRLTLLYHPDRNRSPEAAEMMTRFNLAYDVLGDPDQRAAYDRARFARQRRSPTGNASSTHSRTDPSAGRSDGETHSEDARHSRPESGPSSESSASYPGPAREDLKTLTLGLVAGLLGVVGVVWVWGYLVDAVGFGEASDSSPIAVTPLTTSPAPDPRPVEKANNAIPRTTPTITPRPAPTVTPRPAPTVTPRPEPTAVPKAGQNALFVTKWGRDGSVDGQFDGPDGVAVAPDGSVYVTDSGNHRIQKFTSAGVFFTKWGTKGSGDGDFLFPQGVAVAPDGSVYVADQLNNRIQKFTAGP